jgi:hypothetical protein
MLAHGRSVDERFVALDRGDARAVGRDRDGRELVHRLPGCEGWRGKCKRRCTDSGVCERASERVGQLVNRYLCGAVVRVGGGGRRRVFGERDEGAHGIAGGAFGKPCGLAIGIRRARDIEMDPRRIAHERL